MHKLKSHIVYLAGPIDSCKEGGKTWRQDISKFFYLHGIGVFNPTDKPLGQDEGINFTDKINQYKMNRDYTLASSNMKNVVGSDLHMLDLSNFVVALIDPDIHTCGTYSEITYAALEKKPICIVCPKGIHKIPNWLWGLCDHSLFFSSFYDLKQYFMTADFSSKPWRLIDYSKVFVDVEYTMDEFIQAIDNNLVTKNDKFRLFDDYGAYGEILISDIVNRQCPEWAINFKVRRLFDI